MMPTCYLSKTTLVLMLVILALTLSHCATPRPTMSPPPTPDVEPSPMENPPSEPQPVIGTTVEIEIEIAKMRLRAPDGRVLWEAEAEEISGSSDTVFRLREAVFRSVDDAQPIVIESPHLEWDPQQLLLRAPQGGIVTWGVYRIEASQLQWITEAGILTGEGETSFAGPEWSFHAQRWEAEPDRGQALCEGVQWEAPLFHLQGTSQNTTFDLKGHQASLDKVDLLIDGNLPATAERMHLESEPAAWTAYQAQARQDDSQLTATRLWGNEDPAFLAGAEIDVASDLWHLTAQEMQRHGDEWRFQRQVVVEMTSPPATLHTDELSWQPPLIQTPGRFQLKGEFSAQGTRLKLNTETEEMEFEDVAIMSTDTG